MEYVNKMLTPARVGVTISAWEAEENAKSQDKTAKETVDAEEAGLDGVQGVQHQFGFYDINKFGLRVLNQAVKS